MKLVCAPLLTSLTLLEKLHHIVENMEFEFLEQHHLKIGSYSLFIIYKSRMSNTKDFFLIRFNVTSIYHFKKNAYKLYLKVIESRFF